MITIEKVINSNKHCIKTVITITTINFKYISSYKSIKGLINVNIFIPNSVFSYS